MENSKGLEFDPGFGSNVMVFQPTIEYLYMDINRFKNLSQKKLKFKQYHKKFIDILNNNLGFYVGCLLWAGYVINQEEQPILNNHCFGTEFDEASNVAEVDFAIKFVELFPKDMKYFMSQVYEFEPYVLKILELYKEFLQVNKGFVETKTNRDLKLPKGLNFEDVDNFKNIIEEVIISGDLSKLLEHKDLILCQIKE